LISVNLGVQMLEPLQGLVLKRAWIVIVEPVFYKDAMHTYNMQQTLFIQEQRELALAPQDRIRPVYALRISL
jgi:hypothetical protein